jgi:two-component sensor histidine kinase
MAATVLASTTLPSPQPAAVVDFLLHLSFARTLDQIGAVIRERLRGIVGADGIAFILRDEDRCHYFDEDAVGPLWKGQKFPMTNCVSGWAMLNRQSVVIEDIYADSRVPHDAYRPTFVKSLAMVPIRPEAPLGAIGAYWSVKRRASDEELALMQTIVNAAALAIENARLFQGMQDTLGELATRKREAEALAEERQVLLQRTEAALAQRDVLLREVHHRVKNNFQTIMSMLRLQQRHGGPPEEVYSRSLARIRAMALVHEHLYQSNDLSRIDLTALLHRLTGAIAEANDAEGKVALRIMGEPSVLVLDKAVPLSLLVSEIVTNSYKHAFADRDKGEISIDVGATDRAVSIAIHDNGRGFDPNGESGGFGLRLIGILAKQLDAAMSWGNGRGTSIRLEIPTAAKASSRI